MVGGSNAVHRTEHENVAFSRCFIAPKDEFRSINSALFLLRIKTQ